MASEQAPEVDPYGWVHAIEWSDAAVAEAHRILDRLIDAAEDEAPERKVLH